MSIKYDIVLPIARAINLALNTAARTTWSPLLFFATGANGGWYEIPTLAENAVTTTIWQDSARTTPVTALGQPVGAIDDKSGNTRHLLQATAAARGTYLTGNVPATFGTELISNGDFASDTVWTKGSGCTIAGGVGVFTASSGAISEPITVTAGKVYQVVWTVSGYSAGTLTARFTGGTTTNGQARSANGTYTALLRAEAGNTTFGIVGAGATANIDNVSVTEVLTCTGNPCVYFDGADDNMAESSTHTLSLPVYIIAALSKVNQDALGVLGGRKGSTDYAMLANITTTSRFSSVLRHNTLGNVTATSANNVAPVATPFVADGLHVAGTSVVKVDNTTQGTAVNGWTTETLTLSKVTMAHTNGTAATAHYFFGGMYLLADPGASGRANSKTYFGRKSGQTL